MHQRNTAGQSRVEQGRERDGLQERLTATHMNTWAWRKEKGGDAILATHPTAQVAVCNSSNLQTLQALRSRHNRLIVIPSSSM